MSPPIPTRFEKYFTHFTRRKLSPSQFSKSVPVKNLFSMLDIISSTPWPDEVKSLENYFITEAEHDAGVHSTFLLHSRTSSRSSASLNQNFVRLNLKRKTYARKGAKMKGEAYKRFMWKQRNRGGGGGRGGGRGGGWSGGKFQSKGNDTCFKCGQQGHWATQCNGEGDGHTHKCSSQMYLCILMYLENWPKQINPHLPSPTLTPICQTKNQMISLDNYVN